MSLITDKAAFLEAPAEPGGFAGAFSVPRRPDGGNGDAGCGGKTRCRYRL